MSVTKQLNWSQTTWEGWEVPTVESHYPGLSPLLHGSVTLTLREAPAPV